MATVDVILRSKIESLGAEADVVKVRRGYARNFLIPKGKAFEATKGNMVHLQNLKKQRAEREANELTTAEQTASKLNKLRIKLELNLGQGGKAFGAVTAQDIVDAVAEKSKGLALDRHCIELEKPIKTTGSYTIPVKLHADVSANLKVEVVAKGEDNKESAGK